MTDNVGKLLTQRDNHWGDAVGTHVRIAQVWTGILNHEVQPVQVALMMEGLKLVRASINPADPDSFHDAQGYDRIAELIAGHRTSLDDRPATEPSDCSTARPEPSEFVTTAHAEVQELVNSTEATPLSRRCICFHMQSMHVDGHRACTSFQPTGRCDCVRFAAL